MKRLTYIVLFFLSGSLFAQSTSCLRSDVPPLQINPSKAEVRILLKETVGPVVPVTELDLGELLKKRVLEAQRLGLIRKELDKTRKNLRSHAREPVSLGLPHSREAKTWRFTLMDEKHLEKVSAEVRVALQSQTRRYAFFDADNEKQKKWAVALAIQEKTEPLRLVSVKGDRIAFEKETGIALFSDQGGVLTRRFAVTEIPALVRITYREGIGQTFP